MTEGSEALYRAAKMIADNIAEFGTVTDGVFLDALDVAVAMFYEDHPDKSPFDEPIGIEPEDRPGEIKEALKGVMAALVAALSIIERAEIQKTQPSKAVASDTMFKIMMKDYDKALDQAREVLK